MAVVPWTPARANAFRSACIPAPPPESEPAIDRQTGMRPWSGTAAKDRRGRATVRFARLRTGPAAGVVLGLAPAEVDGSEDAGADQHQEQRRQQLKPGVPPPETRDDE